MSTKTTRTYLSIGEVLSLLRTDFPDVTISKIRFLEGQGLISPERTSSGYRKFHDPDVERLRFVLRHQREHFLPLKVIKERMEAAGLAPAEPATPSRARRNSVSELVAALQESPPTRRSVAELTPPTTAQPAAAPAPPDGDGVLVAPGVLAPEAERPAAPAARRTPAAAAPVDDALGDKPAGASLSLEEVAAQAGLDVAAVEALVDHGLFAPESSRSGGGFDEDCVAVAKAAAGFFSLGLEPRHLKLLRHSVDRELGMIEALVLPMLQQRTPEGRVRARERATQLARLGTSMRAAMLRRALRQLLN
jgi:DNA-binding transcriptional MerR regulator